MCRQGSAVSPTVTGSDRQEWHIGSESWCRELQIGDWSFYGQGEQQIIKRVGPYVTNSAVGSTPQLSVTSRNSVH